MELSSIKYILSDLKALCEGNASKNSVDFFDSSFTYFNESIEVPCCSPNATLTAVTCGQGTSCIGQCSAIGASLCLSGNCTGDPEDCNLILDSAEARMRSSVATLSSDKLKHCYPACKVKHIPGCCFHASCYAIRPKLCSKMNYFSSNSFSVLSCSIIFFPQLTLARSRVASPMVRGVVKLKNSLFLMPHSWTMEPIPSLVRDLVRFNPDQYKFWFSTPVSVGLQSWLYGSEDSNHNLCEGALPTTSQALTND